MVTPVGKPNAVAHLMEAHQVSQRRACDVLRIDRSTVRYRSRRSDDTDLCDAIKLVSRERRLFGCRRIHVMIAREGFAVNHKKVRRIYREEKLQVRRRGGRKRAEYYCLYIIVRSSRDLSSGIVFCCFRIISRDAAWDK